MKTIVTHSAEETKSLSEAFLSNLLNTNIVALTGELGAGKTTFSQGIGSVLGITKRMISPTFVVVRSYDLEKSVSHGRFTRLYHVDLYRIEDPDDIISLGLLDFMKDPRNLIVIEWPEKMGRYLPAKRIEVQFKTQKENEREITISEYGNNSIRI